MGSICTECGLCCDGTLFSWASTHPSDDLAALIGAGALVVTDVSAERFKQPCPALEAQCCTIYDSRPTTCREYRCKLLKRVEAGQTDKATARDIIASVIDYRDRVRHLLEPLVGSPGPRAILDLLERMERTGVAASLGREERSSLMLNIAALRLLIATHLDSTNTVRNDQGPLGD